MRCRENLKTLNRYVFGVFTAWFRCTYGKYPMRHLVRDIASDFLADKRMAPARSKAGAILGFKTRALIARYQSSAICSIVRLVHWQIVSISMPLAFILRAISSLLCSIPSVRPASRPSSKPFARPSSKPWLRA